MLAVLAAILIIFSGCQSATQTGGMADHYPPNPSELHAEPGPDRIRIFIGGYGKELHGVFYVEQGTTLESVLEWSGARDSDSFAVKVNVVRGGKEKIYRFRKTSRAKLESMALQEGDKILFPSVCF